MIQVQVAGTVRVVPHRPSAGWPTAPKWGLSQGWGRIWGVAGRGDGERSEPLAPAGYEELLEQLKQRVRSGRVQAARAANVELLRLY